MVGGTSVRSRRFASRAPGRVRLHVSLTRWVAVIGQLFILFVHFSLAIGLPLMALLPAVALSALVNLALGLRLKATTRLRAQRSGAVRLRHPAAVLPRGPHRRGAEPVRFPADGPDRAGGGDPRPALDRRHHRPGARSASPSWRWPVGPCPGATAAWRCRHLPGRRLGGVEHGRRADRGVRLERGRGGPAALGGADGHPARPGARAAALDPGRPGRRRGPPARHAAGDDQHHRQGAGARGCRTAARSPRPSSSGPGQALPRAPGRARQARRRGRGPILHRFPFSSMLEHIAAEFARPEVEVKIDRARRRHAGAARRADPGAAALAGQPDRQRHPVRGGGGADPPAAVALRAAPGDRGRRAGLSAGSARLAGRAVPVDQA